jgi:hypothetical protein
MKVHLPQLQISPGLLVASDLGFVRGDERRFQRLKVFHPIVYALSNALPERQC